MQTLPMDDAIFLEVLSMENLLSTDLKEKIKGTTTTANKVDLFLDEVIQPSVDTGQFEPFNKLLSVMSDEEYVNRDYLSKLAEQIREKIDEETSIISMKVTG